MTRNFVYNLFYLVAFGIAIVFAANYFGAKKYQPDNRIDAKLINQTVYTDTADVIKRFNADIKPKFIVKYVSKKLNQDSLYNWCKEYWLPELRDSLQGATFIAQADTTFQDSLVSIKASFISPLMLHPESYFEFTDVKVKEKYITKTVTNEIQLPLPPETFWDRFNASISTGFGYGWINKQMDFFTGLTISYKLKNIF